MDQSGFRLDTQPTETEPEAAGRETVQEEVHREVYVVYNLEEFLPQQETSARGVAVAIHGQNKFVAPHGVYW